MTDIIFTIPSSRSDLLNDTGDNYVVRDILTIGDIISKLKEARQSLRDEGPDFILDNFDTYFLTLENSNNLAFDVIFKAFEDLQKATLTLSDSLRFIFEDVENLNDDLKGKQSTILKMLIYIFTQFITFLEQKELKNQNNLLGKSRKQKTNQDFNVNKQKVIESLNNIVQLEINLFWNPPVVEQDFTNIIAETCFLFLHNPAIKQDKDLKVAVFGLFGHLIKNYDYGKTFVMKLIQSIRLYEHVVQCVPDGVKFLVDQFGLKSLIHNLICEATEWQVDETFNDVQGSRCCSILLTDLAVLMPDLMIPEVMYLNQYLHNESVPLRTSVLNVITEVILKVLTNHELNDSEKESRDEFLRILLEHTRDVTANVRSKVIQNFARLQKENAIPLSHQEEVLQVVIKHLQDKGVMVRKSAIACVTIFLQHNPYGGNLKLGKIQEELGKKRELLNRMEESYKEVKLNKIKELEADWSALVEDLRKAIEENIDKESEDEEEDGDDEDKENENPNQPVQPDKDEMVAKIKQQLKEKEFVEAFKLARKLKDQVEEWKDMKKLNTKNEIELYIFILRTLYMDTTKIIDELRTGVGMTDEDVRKIETVERMIVLLEDAASFLKIIDSVIEPMKKLLFTPTITDMHEAIQFFTTAYQFQIDNINGGIMEMLKIMQHKEADRKEAVIEAFKTIYLTTNANSMTEHTTTIVNRLISLLKEISCDKFEDLQNIVSEWTAKGILDNSVIDMLWQYYTGRVPSSNEDVQIAAMLLRMCSIGRTTIIQKNIKVVTTIAFSEKGENDMMLVANSCHLLSVAGREKIDIKSKEPPFKIKYFDQMFVDLTKILTEKFTEKIPFYLEAMQAGIEFVFRLCSAPFTIIKKIFEQISAKMKDCEEAFITIRFCQLIGCIALHTLKYLDDTVYRELKRRNNIREERKNNPKNRKNKTKTRQSLNETSANESVLEGAVAEDTDAEFILNVLEHNILSPSSSLGQYTSFLIEICQRPDVYDDILLQKAALTALMRYMLISSKFCRDNMRLLFTIFEKTTYPDLKCLILIHCSDFLTRFPNVIEPWTPRIYEKLKDPLIEVRKTAFFILSSLILRDMIRAHSHIAEMAVCINDEKEEISQMCRTFFLKLSQKENNLPNLLPDIFSHLAKMDLSEENFRYIMKFLFDLIDKSKRTENLVDRFCIKYSASDADLNVNRNITYCLTLINYNDKALKKLQECYPLYKHHLHNQEIYSFFQEILTEASKQKPGKSDLKPIVTEIENLIASVFEINEDGQPAKPPPMVLKTKKNQRGKKKSAKKSVESNDEDFEESIQATSTTSSRKKRRVQTARKKKIVYSSDSD